VPRLTRPPIDRLLPRLLFGDRGYLSPCWIWPGSTDGRGYGTITTGSKIDGTKRPERVHRVTYLYFVGSIPEGYEIDHLCRVSACCNPEHLEAVTAEENRRRGKLGILAPMRCPQGHEFTAENRLSANRFGHRRCRRCHRERARLDRRARGVPVRNLRS